MVVTMVVPDPVHRAGRVGINVAVKRGLMSTIIWMIARLDLQPSGLAVIRPDLQSGVEI